MNMFVYKVALRERKTQRVRYIECLGTSIEDARRFVQDLFGNGFEVVR